ncbi:YtxH domain-containing protein [Flavobacterium sp.]|uniref:YtxH domain-containing protein n=1 Tax=Flavobacterium sp. TaxID=239 RepID=UPI003529897D
MSKNVNNLFWTLLAGVAIGVLVAPDKGSKTRQKIKDKLNEESDLLNEKLSKASENLAQKVSKTKDSIMGEIDSFIKNNKSDAEGIIAEMEKKLAELKKNVK